MRNIDALLNPKSIALIGASQDFNKINGRPLKFLLEKGYTGKIFPVNPNYREIANLPCYHDIEDLPEGVDLGIIMVPAAAVAGVLRKLVARRVPAAIVFSSGFSEIGQDGAILEREIRTISGEYDIALCGPNCLGVVNTFDKVMATFGQYANDDTPAGPVGFVTQSGAFGTAIASLARNIGLGLGYFVNTGNEVGVEFAEVMESILQDDRIRVGAGYIEGLRDGARFIELAQNSLKLNKPLVVTKVGRTSAGARAAASHTGSLAGEDAIFQGICEQFSVVRAPDEEYMLNVVSGFVNDARPGGKRVGLITQSGGAGVLMADKTLELGLEVASLGDTTQHRLKQVIPAYGSVTNPVDITAQFLAQPEIFYESIRIVMEDPGVDVGVVWFQLMHGFVDTLEDLFKKLADIIDKPLLVCWVAGPPTGLQRLRKLGFPVFTSGRAAVEVVAAMVDYERSRALWLNNEVPNLLGAVDIPLGGVQPSIVAYDLLRKHSINLAPSAVCQSEDEAVRQANIFGYPVVVKIESVDIPHKTDIGGVCLGLVDDDSVRTAYRKVVQAAQEILSNTHVDTVLVQKMSQSRAVELVIGLKQDPVFGMVVMVGMGGITLEISRDVVFRKAPVSEKEALIMLMSLKGAALLGQVRGRAEIDYVGVARMISLVSIFGASNAECIIELDINPVLVGTDNVEAVDWLLVTRES